MHDGALIRIRTGDLVLTKNALCLLSYEGGLAVGRQVSAVSVPSLGRSPKRGTPWLMAESRWLKAWWWWTEKDSNLRSA
jgi:hypothetical protein